MRASPGPLLRLSWSTTVLATLLAVLTPATAWLMGERVAPAAPRPILVAGVTAASVSPPAVLDPGLAADDGSERQTDVSPEPHLLVHAEPGLVARQNPWAGAPSIGS